ncbi:MAG: hypothetical protein AAFQ24_04780 [Pseudomonadota bacterium]
MTATNLSPTAILDTSLTARCRETASRLVDAFAVLDIDTIMDQFAEN